MDSLDPREVLAHLNNMGFCNISAHQLKEFINDLKKLIKHDLQKHLDNVDEANTATRPDLYEYLYKTSTTSFKAKCAKKKKEYVPLPSDLKKTSSIQHCQTSNMKKCKTTPQTSVEYSSITTKFSDTDYSKECSQSINDRLDKKYVSSETLAPSLCTDDIEGVTKMKSDSAPMKSRSKAFIRPRAPKKPVNKSDPVALYHAYQSDWNKFKNQMPGESNRNSLRWNIREKMMGHPG